MTMPSEHKTISADEFIDMVNAEIPRHHAFQTGMRAFLYPPGSTGKTATGYSYDLAGGPVFVFADVENRILSTHMVDPSLPRLP